MCGHIWSYFPQAMPENPISSISFCLKDFLNLYNTFSKLITQTLVNKHY